MKELILISIVTGNLSYLISESKIFKPVRELFRFRKFLSGMVSCSYCLSFWLSVLITLACNPKVFEYWLPLSYFMTVVTVWWMAAFFAIVTSLIIKRKEFGF